MDDIKLDWGAELVARQEEFKNSKYILEIGAGDFSRTVSLARLFPNKIFFGIDFEYSSSAQKTVSNNSNLDNVNFIKFNAIKKLFADNLFDFCFSIAVGEHIAELSDFLQEISRILRQGGAYYFVQSPFWTSYKGHHYRHWEPEIARTLGGYLHLLYTPADLKNHLQSIGWLEEASSTAVSRIFERPDLSRLSPTETRKLFDLSSFEAQLWKDIEDENYDHNAAINVVNFFKGRYSFYDVKTKGVEALYINLK